jgi:uncharacterized repeat protein (TIGR03803 family)
MSTQSMRSAILTTSVLMLATCTLLIASANAGERTLHTFTENSNGIAWGGTDSAAGLVADPAGNLYGTTAFGGRYNMGVVFELSRTGKGYWVEKVLHHFPNAPGDGAEPLGGLVFDSAGNLYGTTHNGGASNIGTVFKLTPGRNGNWKETILYSFEAYVTGTAYFPNSGLVMNAAGNLYGTTTEGGGYGAGTVFEVSPTAGGGWTASVLHSFGASQTDGINPTSPYLSLDAAGNLYGVAYQAGPYNSGAVYQLSPASSGQWTETIVYGFTGGTDGSYPLSTITLDSTGNLYGTTSTSSNGRGTVYEISPSSGGGWSEQTLHTFTGADGGEPNGTLIFNPAGNLLGTSATGGGNNFGDVWELSPSSSGTWTPTVLFSFDQANGQLPIGGVIRDAAGNLYGITNQGGNLSFCGYQGCGVVFEVTP